MTNPDAKSLYVLICSLIATVTSLSGFRRLKIAELAVRTEPGRKFCL